MNAASAISTKGAFWFATYAGGLDETLETQVIQQLREIRRRPALVRSFFQHSNGAYISDF